MWSLSCTPLKARYDEFGVVLTHDYHMSILHHSLATFKQRYHYLDVLKVFQFRFRPTMSRSLDLEKVSQFIKWKTLFSKVTNNMI